MKVHLCAIARNEGAYLADWIFHHLYFGFGSIKILLNGTTDSSKEILAKINARYSNVNFEEVDHLNTNNIINHNKTSFQIDMYRREYTRIKSHQSSYLSFLDLDEFWTPYDFCTTIEEYLLHYKSPKIMSFQWLLKHNETLFSRPFSNQNSLSKNQSVKTIFNSNLPVKISNAHNVACLNRHIDYYLADGRLKTNRRTPKVEQTEMNDQIPPAFVMHRIWKSQIEYIAHGFKITSNRPNDQIAKGVFLKSNRSGYLFTNQKPLSYHVRFDLLNKYESSRQKFINTCNISQEIKQSRISTLNRFRHGLAFLQSDIDLALIDKVRRFSRNLDLKSLEFEANSWLDTNQ